MKKSVIIIVLCLIALSFFMLSKTIKSETSQTELQQKIDEMEAQLESYKSILDQNIIRSIKYDNTYLVVTETEDYKSLGALDDKGIYRNILYSQKIEMHTDELTDWVVVHADDEIKIFQFSKGEFHLKVEIERFSDPKMLDLKYLGSSNIDHNKIYFYAINGFASSKFVVVDITNESVTTFDLVGYEGPSLDYVFSDEYDILVYSTYPSFADVDAYEEFIDNETVVELYSFTVSEGSKLIDHKIADKFYPRFVKNYVFYMGKTQDVFYRFSEEN